MADVFLSPEQQTILTERIRGGDLTAEGELVQFFSQRVLALLIARTRDRDAARDLFQDVLLEALKSLRAGRLREGEKLTWFILAIARNLSNNFIRGQRRRREENAISPELASVCVPDPLEGSERRVLVQRALGELGSTDQEILMKTLIEGEQPGTIAQRLGLTAEVVRQRKSRAVKKVTEYIQRMSRIGLGNY